MSILVKGARISKHMTFASRIRFLRVKFIVELSWRLEEMHYVDEAIKPIPGRRLQ